MCPEYGATVGFFPVDEASLSYMAQTGRKQSFRDDWAFGRAGLDSLTLLKGLNFDCIVLLVFYVFHF